MGMLTASCNYSGAEGSRTPDLVNAIHALSQLSYGPRLNSLINLSDCEVLKDLR